jgi:enoyl-CoA hydratase
MGWVTMACGADNPSMLAIPPLAEQGNTQIGRLKYMLNEVPSVIWRPINLWRINMTQVVLSEIIGKVGLIRINRPEAMNALNNDVVDGIGAAIDAYEADENIGCIVITGNEKAFAAGADIGFMKDFDYMHAYKTDFITRNWERIKTTRKPVIAAVAGFALGGGCEMAMMCDMIFAADTAKFGQPEIKLGTLPGAGGTQRLPRAVGKAKAMDMCLTGRMMDASEAEKAGLVARIIPADQLLDETLKAAQTIAAFSLPVVMMIKESVNRAFESSLNEGLLFERRVFHSAFALEDQKEGMAAFAEKRKATFKNR